MPQRTGNAPTGMKALAKAGITTIIVIAAAALVGGSCVATYNKLVRLDQAAAAQWAQVENTYQRRADLVPGPYRSVAGSIARTKSVVIDLWHPLRTSNACGAFADRCEFVPPRAKRARPRNDAQAHPLLVVDPGRSSGSEYASLVS
jgi:hypothetical protein